MQNPVNACIVLQLARYNRLQVKYSPTSDLLTKRANADLFTQRHREHSVFVNDFLCSPRLRVPQQEICQSTKPHIFTFQGAFMGAKLILRKKEYEVPAGITVRKAIQQAGLNPESVLPTRKGELVTGDTILKDGDLIRLVAVISGG